jgi:DNA repair protein RadC
MKGLTSLLGRKSANLLLASDIEVKYISSVPDSYLSSLGLPDTKIKLLRAAVDLSVEIWVKSEQRASVTQPREAFELFRRLSNLAHEELHVIFLSTGKEVIAYREVFRGGMAICPADPRVIWRQAVLMGASGVIMGHNHPSGTTKPSEQDQELTRRCVHIGEIMGIPLLDHLIVAGNNFCTMRTTEPQLWQS